MPRVIIAGCGFLGLAAARSFHEHGFDVVGLTRSSESAAELKEEPFPVRPCNIADPADLESIDGEQADHVIHCASSGRGGALKYREVFLQGARNLIKIAPSAHLLFVSSTSVYAQTNGDWVTEESAAEPQRETGRILLETENEVLRHGGAVARVAGIYGPGRSVILQKFFSGSAVIEGEGDRWINQAHRDDITSALARIAGKKVNAIFNVADNEPIQERVVYEWLSTRFGRPLPVRAPIDLERKRGWTNKRVSNAKVRALGWEPRYPSFFAAVTNDPELLRLI